MRRVLSKVLPTAIAIFTIAGVSHAAGLAASGSLFQTQTIRNTGASLTSTKKMYWKGDNVRIEQYTIDGLNVEIKKGREIYQYIPEQKAALKIVVPADKAVTVQQLLQSEAKAPSGGKKIGTKLVAGIKCDVYSLSRNGQSAKVYMSTDPRFPLPLMTEVKAGTVTQVTETKSIKLNASISNTLFTLPKGTKVKVQSLTAPKPSTRSGEGKKR